MAKLAMYTQPPRAGTCMHIVAIGQALTIGIAGSNLPIRGVEKDAGLSTMEAGAGCGLRKCPIGLIGVRILASIWSERILRLSWRAMGRKH